MQIDAREVLSGELARCHMRRSDLVERISRLNEAIGKTLRQLGETDIRICDLKEKIRRCSAERKAAA